MELLVDLYCQLTIRHRARRFLPNCLPTRLQENRRLAGELMAVTNIRTLIAPLLASARRRQESGRLLRKGNRLYQNGDFIEAAEIYRRAVDVDPERLVIRFNLGLALYKSGDKRAGRAEWERVCDQARGKNEYMREQAEIMLRQFC